MNNPITERMFDENGLLHIVKTQNVEPIMQAIHEIPNLATQSANKTNQRYVGTVPVIMAVAWSKEWNVKLYGKEWLKLARARLDDGEYSKLKVDYGRNRL